MQEKNNISIFPWFNKNKIHFNYRKLYRWVINIMTNRHQSLYLFKYYRYLLHIFKNINTDIINIVFIKDAYNYKSNNYIINYILFNYKNNIYKIPFPIHFSNGHTTISKVIKYISQSLEFKI